MAYLVAVLSLCATSIVSTSGISNEVLTANRERRSIGELTDSKPPLEEVASGGDLSTHSNHNEGLQIQDNLRNLPELSIFKRAPVGFMGMRGKKDYEYSDFSSQDGADPSGKLVYSNLKRAPYGFVGMRGKKFNDNRVPMEFLGLGSKKEFSDLDHYEDLDEASYLQDELHNLYDTEDDHMPEWSSRPISKRAPAAGFFGMRGKKTYEGYSYDANGKRAPTGFMGMRGKKSFNQLYDGVEEEKRDPKGFFGMRGKKFNTPQYEEKRSLAQFFGIRGKKQPFNSGFFGMRGKKEPFEFRGKFVGVRGKKIPEGSLERLESELSDITGNGMNVINQISPEGYAAKRVPSGFVGMRGKKGASDTSSTEE